MIAPVVAVVLAILGVFLVAAAITEAIRRRRYVPRSGELRIKFSSDAFYVKRDFLDLASRGSLEYSVFDCTTAREELRERIPDDEKPAMIQVYDGGEWIDLSRVSW